MDNSINAKDFNTIVSFFNYKEMALNEIGDRFIQCFRGKNATMLCMGLVALYEEYSYVAHVTQRLTISYLIYRLKDLWKVQLVEKSGIFSHPYLAILFKIYWNYTSPPSPQSTDRSLIHVIGQFPKITAQEANFVGKLLCENTYMLSQVFTQSPLTIADNAITQDQHYNVSAIKTFVEEQLHQFRCFSGAQRSPDPDRRVLQSFSLLSNPTLFAELEKIVYSLVPPNGNVITQRQYQQQTPNIPDPNRQNSAFPPLPIKRPDLQQPTSSTLEQDNAHTPIDAIRKIVSGTPMHKNDVPKILAILEQNRQSLANIRLETPEFVKLIEYHPEIAAEYLIQKHMVNSPELHKLLNTILSLDVSVQPMITVSRFTSTCDRLKLEMPEDFLNSYITYLIDTCQRYHQQNLSSAQRIVRMVCVFFSALLRVANFDIKPRIAELLNFATSFSQVKETNQLYQMITQLKNGGA